MSANLKQGMVGSRPSGVAYKPPSSSVAAFWLVVAKILWRSFRGLG